MILLESKHICKNFGPKPALRDVNVTIECGKIVGLLGPVSYTHLRAHET